MRLLARCKSCKRQYDAEGYRSGERFHCHCGALVTVGRPGGHQSRVVRCSACGGPRHAEAKACTYCRADFTIHELDLHTMCGVCSARIADSALFCGHCGASVATEQRVGSISESLCPVCDGDKRLHHRNLAGKMNILECGGCAGLWLNHDDFATLITKAMENPRSRVDDKRPASTTLYRKQEGPMYRPCVVCKALMARRNYGERSGVIIDVCPEHGIWFDSQELAAILRWVREGKPNRGPEARKPLKSAQPPATSGAAKGGSDSPFIADILSFFFD